MKCKHVQQKMLDYTEHVLHDRAHEQVEHHLQSCQVCAQELEALQETLDMLAATPIQEPSESFWNDFTTDVMRKIRKADPPEPGWYFFPSWQIRMASACIIVLILIAGMFAYRSLRKQPSIITTQSTERPATSEMSALNTALQQIVPEELPQRMLDTEFALFDDIGSPRLEIYSGDTVLEGLLSGLSAEEKRALLIELYKMQEQSQ
jgi:hypothetical protein